MGRPSKYSEDIGDQLCELISTSNKGLVHHCKTLKVSTVSVYRWLEEFEEFRNRYARAREAQADFLADEILEIADEANRDTITITKGGKQVEVENTEWTNRSKLRVDARKWIAAKLRPKKYGDRIDVAQTIQELPPLFPDVP